MNKLPHTLVSTAFAFTLTACVSFADPMTTHQASFGNTRNYNSLSNAATTVLAGDMVPGAFPIGEDIAPGGTPSGENNSPTSSAGNVETVDSSVHASVASDTSPNGTDTSLTGTDPSLDGTDAGAAAGGDSSSTSTPSSDSTVISLTSPTDSSAPTGFDTITTVSLAPEPSSMLLAGVVLLGLGVAGRKKRSVR